MPLVQLVLFNNLHKHKYMRMQSQCKYVFLYTCIHIYIHACMHASTSKHTYMPTYLHTYIRNYLCICIYIYICMCVCICRCIRVHVRAYLLFMVWDQEFIRALGDWCLFRVRGSVASSTLAAGFEVECLNITGLWGQLGSFINLWCCHMSDKFLTLNRFGRPYSISSNSNSQPHKST